MQVRIITRLDEIAPADWNALVPAGDPFLCHEFLAALERHGCVGRQTGWLPRHLAAHDEKGRLVAAAPLYLKSHSYGELVFDGSWAEAYRRHGLRYYPKLVSAVPYTPATGPRLLLHPLAEPAAAAAALTRAALELAEALSVSSLHWLFPPQTQLPQLAPAGPLHRMDCQYHWHNPGYGRFDDFLGRLSAKKRKNIRRERRIAAASHVELVRLHGPEIPRPLWRDLHRFYASTFERRGGWATLTRGFFEEVAETLGDRLLVVLAREQREPLGAAICFRSDDALYGRHWGCDREREGVHFEACYYQGIDYCIEQGLARFEPGAQGEHKVSRGFLPTATHSAHWIGHPDFAAAIADFLRRETPMVRRYMRELGEHSPYRRDDQTC